MNLHFPLRVDFQFEYFQKKLINNILYFLLSFFAEETRNINFVSRMKIGFDNEKYLKIQSERIKERIAQFGDKLYLEFGGKLFDDFHAERVLPGFNHDGKLKMLLGLKEQAEVVIVVNSVDIENNKELRL